jgi:hypothetical protein
LLNELPLQSATLAFILIDKLTIVKGGVTAMKYICSGEDHEDLTQQVYDAVLFKPEPRAGFSFFPKLNKKPSKWRVIVTCSKGHENTFEGESRISLPEKVAAKVV